MSKSGREVIDFAFLDSGTGGIPYMLTLKQKMPEARCVYLGDTAHFPYGEKSLEQVTECASASIKLIVEKWNPRTVVIACNTISVTALTELRNLFPGLPIVGTVPAIKLAANVTSNKKIGLLATNATVNHPYCKKLILDFASDCQVFSRGDPDLISFVEHDLFTASEEEKKNAVLPAVNFFKEKDCDTIILGCTHFCHMAQEISKVAGPEVKIVDSRDGVCRQAIKVENSESSTQLFHADYSDRKNLPADETFFVTSLDSSSDSKEYEVLCSRYNIPWGGIIKMESK